MCFLGCKTKNSEKGTIHKKNSKEVFINGVTDEIIFFNYLNIMNGSYFVEANHKKMSKSIKDDTITILLKEIETPQIFDFLSFGDNAYYPTRVFLTPGDSIHFVLNKGKLRFEGKKSYHYNFFLELDKNFDQWTKLRFSKLNADFKEYKKQCDSLYNVRLTFFNNYIKKHKTVSNEFKTAIREELKLEHLLNLIKPRSEIQDIYAINTSEDLATILANSNRDEGDFLNLDNYLDNITLEDLNKPHLVNNLYYKMSIVPLIRQYFVKSDEKPYSKESFTEELTFIKKRFDTTIVKYTTGRLIVDYYERGLGKDENSNEFMKENIKKYKKTITDPTYLEAMIDLENELSAISKIVPKDLKEFVINLSKDTISLNYILKSKQLKVIDFWASWCQPCVKEIIEGKENRKKLIDKYNIEFIYLSTDKDSEKWIDKSIYLSNYLPDSKQYKILSLKKSSFIKFLNIKNSFGLTIPRYIILDKNNKVIDNNAPKPSDAKFKEIIKKLLIK